MTSQSSTLIYTRTQITHDLITRFSIKAVASVVFFCFRSDLLLFLDFTSALINYDGNARLDVVRNDKTDTSGSRRNGSVRVGTMAGQSLDQRWQILIQF